MRITPALPLICLFASTAVAQDDGAVSIDYFHRFVIDGGLITWFVLIPLSVATFALILRHALVIRPSRILDRQDYEKLAKTLARGDVEAALRMSGQGETFLFSVVRRGLVELANSPESAETAVIEATEERATNLLRRIEYLNIIGNVAPMIGLFGTVYGIILAFNKLVEVVRQGGVTQPDQLAEGISVALVTTFWGLIVAIPALAMYGLFRNRIDAIAAQIANMSLDLLRSVTPDGRDRLRVATLAPPEE